MEVLLTAKNGAKLGYECGCYYMKFANSEYFEEIPAFTEDEAWDFFEDNLNN